MILLKTIMQQLLLIKLNEYSSNEGVSYRKIAAVLQRAYKSSEAISICS
jgi:hypothetical protein